jgi:hypothetical protein
MSRPDFGTIGSTVSACEAVVEYLIPHLQASGPGADRQIDRVQIVERHIGQFDKAEELDRWMSTRDGGVRVTALRVPRMENQGNQLIGTIEFAAYVFCADVFAYAKDQRAEVIAGRLAKALMIKGGWKGTGAVKSPEAVAMQNLYAIKTDKKGVAIWAVTWRQDWPLDEQLDMATLEDFLRFDWRAEQADGAPVCEAEVVLPAADTP